MQCCKLFSLGPSLTLSLSLSLSLFVIVELGPIWQVVEVDFVIFAPSHISRGR
uniref:Secreted protein n=1 Tax=Heterorhabditis bacteriophora TaxID=37862 RepID=A0A1I7WKV3_HETBA